ncbi:hypothetical protein QBC34DRAFT_415590 [Podospora aff. communis PSN243]|uniref:Tyrosine--tRNA ligase n=1 Tax=Podospora aff. communis PSN243 TaxID=3040156 RepID=A0AAV9G6A0_9PEZI|nr:hypothetical protein QBC34DRAFT_415590 [Podospora aff. communis PSN243]
MGPVRGLLLGRCLACRRVVTPSLARVGSAVRLGSTYIDVFERARSPSREPPTDDDIERARSRYQSRLENFKGHKRKAELRRKEERGERLAESEILERKGCSAKYTAKVRQAEDEWAVRAESVKAGEIQNTFDMLEERGFVKDITGSKETLRELMRRKRIGAYVGIDPTASSLHIGHLIPLMPLFWMYLHGYQTISLVGGSTAKIGDPTGRLTSRENIAGADMAMNMVLMQTQLKKLWLNVEEEARKRGFEKEWAWERGIVNNNAWWNSQPMLEVLRLVGTALRIGPMLSRDTVKQKMTKGDGVSFAEFSYPIMQGWDWWKLLCQRGVQMQIGGSDQFGNIVAGIEVVKAARENDNSPTKPVRHDEFDDPVGFTTPLLTDSSGVKFGKSAGNAIWLDEYKTSVYDFYGYFVRRPDADVEKLLKYFTFLPLKEIGEVMAEHNKDPSKRVAQHRLALEVATFVHGKVKAHEARDQHLLMYSKPKLSSSPEQYQADESHPVTVNTAPRPDMILPESLLLGSSIAKILYASGLARSTSEGHRLARAQGAYIGGAPGRGNQGRAMNPNQLDFTSVKLWYPQETRKYLIDGKLLILRKGKHNIRIIKMVSDEEYQESGETYPGMPGSGQVRKLTTQLQKLKCGLATASEIEEEMAKGRAKPDETDTWVFPEEKSEQQLELETKLQEEIAKKHQEIAKKHQEEADARNAQDAKLAEELDQAPEAFEEQKDDKSST